MKLRAIALVGAGILIGAFACFQYLQWRVLVAEGMRDIYAKAAIDMSAKVCNSPSKWPSRKWP